SAAVVYRLQQALDSLEHSSLCLPPAFAHRLAVTLRDRQLILFAGAGLSHLCPPSAGYGARLPLWRGLADQVALAFAEEGVRPEDFADLPDFFDYLKGLPQGPARLELAVRAALDDSKVALSPAHAVLGQLPWCEIWTTNFDSLLERASQRAQVDGEREFFHIREHERTSQPYVLHLHGTLHHPHTLATQDYRGWAAANPKLLAYMRERLLNRTVLFAGYGLGDPNLDQVLSWLRTVAQGADVRMFGLFWHMSQARLRQLDLRDHIEAVSFTREEQWQMGFAQIAQRWRALEPEAQATRSSPATIVCVDRTEAARSHGPPPHQAREAAVTQYEVASACLTAPAAAGTATLEHSIARQAARQRALPPDTRSALLHALRDRDESVRRAAIHAMHALTGQWGLLEQLLGALSDAEPQVRDGAGAALRRLARRSAPPRNMPALRAVDRQLTTLAALQGVAGRGDLMMVLLSALGAGQIRGALAHALLHVSRLPEVRAGVLAMLDDPLATSDVRCAAMAALCICDREQQLAELSVARPD
ncbi:MAG TPA: SIR2 family protein, partial [Burkholderiaceae bacterium]